MTTSESKADFFLQNKSIRIDSHNESNRFESRIGMLYPGPITAANPQRSGMRRLDGTDRRTDGRTRESYIVVVVVVVVTLFNHNFVNCKATLIFAIKIYEIKYNISLNNIHTQQ